MTKTNNTNGAKGATSNNKASEKSHQLRAFETVVAKVSSAALADEKKRQRLEEILGKAFRRWIEDRSEAELVKVFSEIEMLITKSERTILSTHPLRPSAVDEIVEKADAEALLKKEAAEAQKVHEAIEKAEKALLRAKEKAAAINLKPASSSVEDDISDEVAPSQDTASEDGKKSTDKK